MSFRESDLHIDVVPPGRAPAAPPKPPPAAWLFAAAMAVSLAIAAFGGLILGILAATQAGPAQSRWTEIVQAHGELQLWGWVAVFVGALTFEFIIRFNQRPAFPTAPRLAIVCLLGAGGIVAAVGQVIGQLDRPLAIAGAVLTIAGAIPFAAIVFGVPAMPPGQADHNRVFFRAAAVWLVVSAIATLVSAFHMDTGVIPLDEARFAIELFIRGFVLNITIAVALRAFPGHLGLHPLSNRSQLIVAGLLNATIVVWAAGIHGFGLPGVHFLQAAGDIGLAITILVATRMFGMAVGVAHWRRTTERQEIMIPIAWLALVIYAIGLAAQALLGGHPNLYETGAVRHIFLLGFMAPLMVAMAHIVLSHFGIGRVVWQNWLTAAFALLVVAWPLRVVPPLIDSSAGNATQGLMGLAGTLAAIALATAAIVTARNAIAIAGRWPSAVALARGAHSVQHQPSADR